MESKKVAPATTSNQPPPATESTSSPVAARLTGALRAVWRSIVARTRRCWRTLRGDRLPDLVPWREFADACGVRRRLNGVMVAELIDVTKFEVEYPPDRILVLSDGGDRYVSLTVEGDALRLALRADAGARAGDLVDLLVRDYHDPAELAADIERLLQLWRIRPRARDSRRHAA